MTAFLPSILIPAGWDQAQPGETMALDHALHASAKAGRAFVAERAAPSGKAYDRAFEQRP